MADSVKTRTLQLVARMLGGPARLRDVLRASSTDVAGWLSGRSEPPMPVLLKALDVILDDLDAGGPRLGRLAARRGDDRPT